MALIKCLKTNTPKEPVILWENPDPTSSFEGIAVTLSESIFDFSMLKIEGRASTDKDTACEIYTTPSYLVGCTTTASNAGKGCVLFSSDGTGNSMAGRMFYAESNGTQIVFGQCWGISYGNAMNSKSIPTKIIGIY